MSSIVKSSIRDQVYDILRHRILSCEYNFGDQLNVVNLTRELGVSNTPIREALSMLCSEGLVVSSMSAKYHVVDLTAELVEEINSSIQVLLTGAYIYIRNAGKLPELTQRLEEIYAAQVKAYQKLKGRTSLSYIVQAIAFDRAFVGTTGNLRLDYFMTLQADLLTLCVRYSYEHGLLGSDDSLEEHKQILEAVRRDDPNLVLERLRQHYDKPFRG